MDHGLPADVVAGVPARKRQIDHEHDEDHAPCARLWSNHAAHENRGRIPAWFACSEWFEVGRSGRPRSVPPLVNRPSRWTMAP